MVLNYTNQHKQTDRQGQGMGFRFDKSAGNVLVICTSCGGTWRAGPFAQQAAAVAAASTHRLTAHGGDTGAANQLTLKSRRSGRG